MGGPWRSVLYSSWLEASRGSPAFSLGLVLPLWPGFGLDLLSLPSLPLQDTTHPPLLPDLVMPARYTSFCSLAATSPLKQVPVS